MQGGHYTILGRVERSTPISTHLHTNRGTQGNTRTFVTVPPTPPPPHPTPCEISGKSTENDGNSASCWNSKGVVYAHPETTQAVRHMLYQ